MLLVVRTVGLVYRCSHTQAGLWHIPWLLVQGQANSFASVHCIVTAFATLFKG